MKNKSLQILFTVFCMIVFFKDGTSIKFPEATYITTDGVCGLLGGCVEATTYTIKKSTYGEPIATIPIKEVKMIQETCNK